MTEVDAKSAYACVIGIVCVEDATGAASDADSTPTVYIYPGNEDDDDYATDLSASVQTDETGVYRILVDPTGWTESLITFGPFWTIVTVVIGGITKKVPLSPFIVIPPKRYGMVVADGANTATTFKVASDAAAHGSWVSGSDDNPSFSILAVMTGDLNGEIAEVDTYDASTQFIVLKKALTATPVAGVVFQLINR